ncbi:MAG TPA: tetratricopeptide repeat protein [Streptosporangiaceae bacterium]
MLVGWVVAVLVAGSAAIGGWPHAWPWVGALTAGVAALAVPVAALWNESRQQRETSARVVREHAHTSGGRFGSDLPRIADTDLRTLRVHSAAVEVPYIHRDEEQQLRECLQECRPVLLIGSSMVGKTRMAAEAVKDMFPDRPIVIPSSRRSLAAMEAADLDVRTCVIWLDDIDRLIGADGITEGAVRRLADADNAIVGTIRSSEYDTFLPTSRIRPPEWDVLAQFERIVLRREFSEGEDRQLSNVIGDKGVRDRIRRIGVGEYVGAAEQITERLRLGPSVNPMGYALVCGAADWFRTGARGPVPAQLLPPLAELHLRNGGEAVLANPTEYQEALSWATQEINPTVRLLTRGDDAYTIADFALDQFARTGDPIPEAIWQLIADHVPVEDLVRVGIRARDVTDDLDLAEKIWRRAANAEVTDGMFILGCLLADRRDTASARRWWRKAADQGSALAMFNLGVLLETDRSDLDQAEHWYRRAHEAGHAEAAMALGDLAWDHRADREQAERWYRTAAEAGHGYAMFRLCLLVQDRNEADEWCRKAADAGVPEAMSRLSMDLRERGQYAEAEQWNVKANEGYYRRGAINGIPEQMHLLSITLEQQGDAAQAEYWLRKAADAGYPVAMAWLGLRLAQQDNAVQAEQWYRKAANAGHPNALKLLDDLLRQRGGTSQDQ